MNNTSYLCPICQQALLLNNKTYRCSNNHGFDLAKEGYVNLLPVQHKRSLNPGDNKAMVNARRSFLTKGFYQPLANKLLQLKQQYAPNNFPLLDAGCGEGYYTHQFFDQANNESPQIFGIDIAKEAIKKAAKSYKNCQFSVGTLSKLSFSDSIFGTIISIYAPIIENEFSRVLADNGILITVTPAKQHLFELKSFLYEQVKEHDEERILINSLNCIHQEQLSYTMSIPEKEDRLNLMLMTPFAFKGSEQAKQALAEKDDFECQASFLIQVFKKNVSAN